MRRDAWRARHGQQARRRLAPGAAEWAELVPERRRMPSSTCRPKRTKQETEQKWSWPMWSARCGSAPGAFALPSPPPTPPESQYSAKCLLIQDEHVEQSAAGNVSDRPMRALEFISAAPVRHGGCKESFTDSWTRGAELMERRAIWSRWPRPERVAARPASPPRSAKVRSEVGGERGIRTLGRVSPTHAFQACSFNHSDISPFDALRSLAASRASGPNSLA